MSNRADNKSVSDVAARWVARRDAGLTPFETEELQQWLDADERHRDAFDHYARAWSAFDRPARAGAQDAVMRELQARSKRRRARRVSAMSGAACAFAVVLVFALMRRQPDAGELSHAGAQQQSSVVVSRPESRVLEDGSTVELKPGAIIDVRYDETTRRVILERGEAHFQVAKGLPRPFVVEAGGMEVRAVGTAFAVQIDSAQMEVLVTEGRVAVEKTQSSAPAPLDTTGGDDDPGAELDDARIPPTFAAASPAVPIVPVAVLGVCERVVLDITMPTVTAPVVTPVSPAELNARLSWRISRLEFSSTPLAETVALINRSSHLPDGSAGARLVLDPASPGLAAEPVSGVFRADNIEAFVQVLGLSMGIEAERRGDEIILRKPR
ncbi:FecR family protein [Ereboglobus luteus]|nr:FecR domain-containing protein [Ereboglobus luteus]